METITTNTKTVELTDEEVHVQFTSAFPYFWVRNDGSGTVLVSLSPNIEEGKDGVIEVLAGSSAGTMHGYNATRSDLYLLGSGKVQIMGTYSPENPFRKARKGGDRNAEPLVLLDGTRWYDGSTENYMININPEENSYSSLTQNGNDLWGWSIGKWSRVIIKNARFKLSENSSFDSAVFSTNEEIDLTDYNAIGIDFAYKCNRSGVSDSSLGGAFFKVDMPETLPQVNTVYDWNGWDKMQVCNERHGQFYADISKFTGQHKLCFGVKHGAYSEVYSEGIGIYKIILM